LSDATPDAAGAALREQLAAIDKVRHVSFDEDRREAWLILSPGGDPHVVEEQAASLAGEYRVRVAFEPEGRDRQRVRFVEVQRETLPDQHIRFTVTLEWAGTEYRGEATGEKGDALEMRTVATAALEAVMALAPVDLQLRLAGVKQVRAFDTDLMVIALYRPDDEPHNLVGAVVKSADPHRAAAVAVLNALNRILGNYLVLP
jgi:hypothetical protein